MLRWQSTKAKSGDNVNPTFFRIAAELAGVVLSKSDLEGNTKVLEANIVNHQQHDPEQVRKQRTHTPTCN